MVDSKNLWDKAASTMTVQARVKELRGDFAVLILLVTNTEVLWPRQFMPADAKVGDTIPLTVGKFSPSDDERAAIARKILEELVN